ncbi:MAG: hypothetical protein CMH31_06820 [Micavibrio sp.]|nr:hypothetical protein [Micavibrio sp.]|tara:strand:- start:701 stop:1600 length:900 start_codon:yes stop_codon:yes gene_type:complete
MKLLFLALFLLSPSIAVADDGQIFTKPGSEYVNQTIEMMKDQTAAIESKKGYIKPHTLYVSIVRHDYFEEDQFGILIDTGDIITGCWKLSPLEYEASFTEEYYMDIKVKNYKREAIETNCPKGNQTVSALVVLNKSDLQERGIKQIRFSNEVARDRYEVSFYNDRVELKPMTQLAFKIQNFRGTNDNKIISYDSNKNVVALHVPMAKKTDDVASAILRVARQNNLAPLDLEMANRYKGNKSSSTFFFMDEDGSTIDQIGTNPYTEVGSINVKRPYDGPNGRTEIEKPLKVFATLPGKTL